MVENFMYDLTDKHQSHNLKLSSDFFSHRFQTYVKCMNQQYFSTANDLHILGKRRTAQNNNYYSS